MLWLVSSASPLIANVIPPNIMLQTPSFAFAFWLCLVAVVGLARIYDAAPPQAIGLTIALGTLAILVLSKLNHRFGDELKSVSTERLICWHAIRAPIGAGFLVMASEGLLPDLFANRAGYGDMLTAISGVAVVAICAPLANQRSKAFTYIIWNLLGLTDLLLAVTTGIYMAFRIPDSMIWIARLPLLLVPAFILPVLFATHIMMLKRLIGALSKPVTIAE